MQNKFIDFIITQNCTYSCSYCSQSKKYANKKLYASKKTINSFLNFLDKIDNSFEITITGGEAILHNDFFDLIEKIKNKNFKLNLISNLSFEIDIYNKIFKILDNSLIQFSLSAHLEQIKDFQKFIEKLEKFIQNKPTKTKIVLLIPIYNIDDKKEKQIEKLIDLAQKYEIAYDFQHIRILDKYKKNSKCEEKYLKNSKKISSFAKMCLAGCDSCVIYENGEVYRCYSSRFKKSNYLGNINDKNFNLNAQAKICTHKNCTCPKPLIYNQITAKSDFLSANISRFSDFIFLPFLIIKNFSIVKTKLKHLIYFKR